MPLQTMVKFNARAMWNIYGDARNVMVCMLWSPCAMQHCIEIFLHCWHLQRNFWPRTFCIIIYKLNYQHSHLMLCGYLVRSSQKAQNYMDYPALSPSLSLCLNLNNAGNLCHIVNPL